MARERNGARGGRRKKVMESSRDRKPNHQRRLQTPKRSTHSTDLSLTFFSSPKKTFSTSCLDTVPRVPVWPDVPDLYYFHVNTAQLQTYEADLRC